MKKLVRLVILGAILCPIISIAISCSEEADCSMTARPMVNCILYRVDPETQYVENDTLDSLTVTAYGTDSIIINNQIQLVRDNAYIEREKEALDEHDTYVVTEKGYEAKDGCHDDLLMSRAIGLYISGSIDPPKLVNKIVIRHKKPVSEASF